jgi:hypothetical protein
MESLQIMDKIDLVEYGKLVQAVENLESKVNTMEHDIKKLVAMAERSKGSLWAIMGAASVFGGFITWLAELVFKK